MPTFYKYLERLKFEKFKIKSLKYLTQAGGKLQNSQFAYMNKVCKLNKIKFYSKNITDIKELYSFKKELLEDLIILPIRNDDNTKKSLVNFTPLTAQNFNKNKVFPYKSTWITPRFDV